MTVSRCFVVPVKVNHGRYPSRIGVDAATSKSERRLANLQRMTARLRTPDTGEVEGLSFEYEIKSFLLCCTAFVQE
jgi:hypothetical protein